MEEKEFNSMINNLKKPDFIGREPDKKLKLAVVSSKKSAAIGLWFLAVPCFFWFSVFIKYYFNVNLHIIDIFKEFLSSFDKSSAGKLITPVFFIGLPIFGIIINSLAIMFFEFDKEKNQVNISIKLKMLNIILIIASLAIASIFMLYLITENINHLNN